MEIILCRKFGRNVIRPSIFMHRLGSKDKLIPTCSFPLFSVSLLEIEIQPFDKSGETMSLAIYVSACALACLSAWH